MSAFSQRTMGVVLALLLVGAIGALAWRDAGVSRAPEVAVATDAPPPASATAQPPPTTAAAPPAPRRFRAPPAIRQQYADRIVFADSDLGPYAEELRQFADGGDADAAAALAELYRGCAGDLNARTPDTGRCGSLGRPGDAERRRLLAMATEWQGRAASLGHGASVLAAYNQFLPDPFQPPGPQELALRHVIVDLLRDGDYAAFLQHPAAIENLGAEYASESWELAFCTLLAPCAPGPQRYCAHAGRCDPEHGGAIRRLHGLPQRQQRIVAGQQAEILEILRSGDYERLWRKPRTLPGRG